MDATAISPVLPHLGLAHTVQHEDKISLQSVEETEDELHREGYSLDQVQVADGPSQSHQGQDGEGVLKTLFVQLPFGRVPTVTPLYVTAGGCSDKLADYQ